MRGFKLDFVKFLLMQKLFQKKMQFLISLYLDDRVKKFQNQV